jgi:hypothetical protein
VVRSTTLRILEEKFLTKAKSQGLEMLEQIQQGDWLAFAMRVK